MSELSGELRDNVYYQTGLVTGIADVAEMWGVEDHKTVRTVRFLAHKADTFLEQGTSHVRRSSIKCGALHPKDERPARFPATYLVFFGHGVSQSELSKWHKLDPLLGGPFRGRSQGIWDVS